MEKMQRPTILWYILIVIGCIIIYLVNEFMFVIAITICLWLNITINMLHICDLQNEVLLLKKKLSSKSKKVKE